jgi:hypothetical protein
MMHRIACCSLAALGLAGVARADVAKAKQLNTQGMQKYAKQDYEGALALFRAAIAEDPSSVKAHYNAASVLSLMGKAVEAGKELDVLAASTDPAAAKALAKGKTDPDLERASTEAHVREVLGLPAIATMSLDAVLLERAGRWGADAEACAGDVVTITFKKNGTLAYRGEFACDETDNVEDHKGTWKVSGKTVTLKGDKLFDGATITIAPCEDAPTAACLQVDGGDVGANALSRGEGRMR